MHQLVNFIHREIAECGPIAFARFMELALYCPELGFYEKEGDKVGRGGDFFTSVSVGPIFGELLAFQFGRWFEQSECTSLQLVEAGAHDGKLAADILGWLRIRCPKVFQLTTYRLLEPSARRRQWQRQRLAEFESKVMWVGSLGADSSFSQPTDSFAVIFSNELLDAMPVHRCGWDAKAGAWFEWGVDSDGEKFVWARLTAPPPTSILGLPSSPDLLSVLPDGYTIEVSPTAEKWWDGAARWLRKGKLVTFDYGFDAAGEFQPERLKGTLRAYQDHRANEDVLGKPGEQDITAHVNFARIEKTGIAAGLDTEAFDSQARFLTRIAAEAWKPDSNFGDWNPKRTRQFHTLTHPEHLGNRFRALVQSRA